MDPDGIEIKEKEKGWNQEQLLIAEKSKTWKGNDYQT